MSTKTVCVCPIVQRRRQCGRSPRRIIIYSSPFNYAVCGVHDALLLDSRFCEPADVNFLGYPSLFTSYGSPVWRMSSRLYLLASDIETQSVR